MCLSTGYLIGIGWRPESGADSNLDLNGLAMLEMS